MSRRDEADKLISRIYRLGFDNGRGGNMTKLHEIGTEYVQASARLLALLAPEPEPRKRVMVGGSDHTTVVDAELVPLYPAPEPEPELSDEAIEAAAKAWIAGHFGHADADEHWKALPESSRVAYLANARNAIAAARAARQTGGES